MLITETKYQTPQASALLTYHLVVMSYDCSYAALLVESHTNLDLILVTALRLLRAELEVLRPLQAQLLLRLALLALQAKDDLPRRLGLLVEDGLRLPAKPHLLRVVPALPLGEVERFSGLVLGDLVDLVLAALLARAEGLVLLGDVDHFCMLWERNAGACDVRGYKKIMEQSRV